MTLLTIERPYKEDGKQGKGLVSQGIWWTPGLGDGGVKERRGWGSWADVGAEVCRGGAIDWRSGVLRFYGGECAGNLPKAKADNYTFCRTSPKNYVAIV